MSIPTITFDAMLVKWTKDSSGSKKVILELSSEEDLAHFEVMTVKQGKRAGQRLRVVAVQIGDDEKPVTHSTWADLGPKTQQAVALCKDVHFQEWVRAKFGELPGMAMDMTPELASKYVILTVCKINSRKDLETNAQARTAFNERIAGPFNDWREAHGR